ncbi:MAG: heavy-metal-associated domain-containing protein [Prochlorothrix sp.]|nr:heavy-metal-associated domain-containing protein [Prochlorothrix sp.]
MTLTLTIPDMACSACAEAITQAVTTVDAGAVVKADTETKVVTIDTQQPADAIRAAIVAAGYSPN